MGSADTQMANRHKPSFNDRYAFFHAWEGRCSYYCGSRLVFADFEMDHIIPWHLSNDSMRWLNLLKELGLDETFNVNSDLNLRPTCRRCNQSKTGDVLPSPRLIFLLNEASKRASRIAELRESVVTDRKRNNALATIGKAADDDPEFRRQISGMFPIDRPGPGSSPITPWPDTEASRRVKAVFGAASANLLAWPREIDGEWIDRPEFEQLENAMASTEGQAIALLGPPGCGKSAMLAKLGAKLASEGRVLLAIKADMLPRHLASMPDLDREWGLVEPLPIVLERLAGESSVVILIDQLDALAPLMDSHSERLSAMLALINRALLMTGVTVIVSCRQFDAQHDMRLKSILHPAKLIELVDPPWETVQPLLEKHGYSPDNWPQPTKDLLSRPQHLKMFLESFKPGSESPAFTTLQSMLERVLEDLDRKFGTGPEKALDAIVAAMSAVENLWVPLAPFRRDFPSEITQLLQTGLIKRDPTELQLGLTHQTLFEFLRGRSLIIGPTNLIEEILRKQDGLSIRPVLWSAIAYLRLANPPQYRQDLKHLFGEPKIRLHIKLLLVDFLGTVADPLPEEAECLKTLLPNPQVRPHVMKAIEGKAGWFSLMKDAVARCSEDGPVAAWQASFVLGPALAFDRAFVLSTLEASWLKQPEMDGATFNVFRDCTAWDERMVRIIEQVVSRAEIREASVGHHAAIIGRTLPVLAIRLVRAKLDFDLVQAQASIDPLVSPEAEEGFAGYMSRDLLESKRLKPLKQLVERHRNWCELKAVAKLAPGELVEGLWTWVEQLTLLLSSSDGGHRGYVQDYEWHFGQSYASYLAASIWEAAPLFARSQPERFLHWVSTAGGSEVQAIHQLIRRGLIQIAQDHPEAVADYLLGDHRRLKDATQSRTVELLAAIGGQLKQQQTDRLIELIESWEPYDLDEIQEEFRAKYRVYAVNDRQRLLDALSPQAQSSVIDASELRSSTEGISWVGPPINVEQMEKMNDEELLRALAEWPDSREHAEDYRMGGSTSVANEFEKFSKTHPQRALTLVTRMQPTEQEYAAAAAIAGLALADGQVPEQVCELLHQLLPTFQSEHFRTKAAWAFVRLAQRGAGLGEQSIQDLLELLAYPKATAQDAHELPDEMEDPELAAEKPEKNESVLWHARGGVLPEGDYPILLGLTMGLLRQQPAARERWLGILTKHLEGVESPEVWHGLLRELRYLRGGDQAKAAEFLTSLFARFPRFFASVEGVRFVASNHSWLPSSFFHTAMAEIEHSTWVLAARAAGELWMLRAGLVPEDAVGQGRLAQVLSELSSGETSEFLCGFVDSASETWMSPKLRETSTHVLIAAVPEASGEIAASIASAFIQRETEQLPGDSWTDELLAALRENPSILTIEMDPIVDRLKELLQKGYSPTVVGDVCRLILETAGASIADTSRKFFGAGRELTDVAITLQRFPKARSDGTWIFEQLLMWDAYSVSETKMALDQRMM